MSKCWARTHIDITHSLKIDLKDYILSDPYRPNEYALYVAEAGGIWTLDPNTLFDPNWIRYIKHDLGLELDIAQIFFRKPYYQHPGAHVDIAQDLSLYGGGLNWTLDPDDAHMVWYEYPSNEPCFNQRSTTDVNKEWPLEQLTEVDRCIIGQQPTLVRTDIPHTVDMSANERWLVSARFLECSSWSDYETLV
jgi:hypothetical protein